MLLALFNLGQHLTLQLGREVLDAALHRVGRVVAGRALRRAHQVTDVSLKQDAEVHVMMFVKNFKTFIRYFKRFMGFEKDNKTGGKYSVNIPSWESNPNFFPFLWSSVCVVSLGDHSELLVRIFFREMLQEARSRHLRSDVRTINGKKRRREDPVTGSGRTGHQKMSGGLRESAAPHCGASPKRDKGGDMDKEGG